MEISYYSPKKSMFKTFELKFSTIEHKFKTFELKFGTFEHNFLLGKETTLSCIKSFFPQVYPHFQPQLSVFRTYFFAHPK